MCVGGLMARSESAVRWRRARGAVRSVAFAGVVATVLAGLTPPGLLGPAPAWSATGSATVRTVAVVSPVGPSVLRPAPTGPAPGPGGGGSGGGGESNPAPSPGGHKESSDSSGSSGSGSSDSKPAPKPAADSGAAKSSDGGNQPAPKPAAENAASKPSDGGTQPTTAPAQGPRNEPQQAAAGAQPTPAPAAAPRPDAQPATSGQQPTVAPAAAPPPGATPPGNNGGPTVAPAAPPRPVPPGGPQLAADQTPLGARPPPAAPSGSLAERQAVGPLTPEVVSGPNKLTMDPATSGMVNDYRKTLPSDVSAGQLDFRSTPVAAPRWNQLVGQEGGDVGKFNSMVNEVGGPNPQVTQTPLVLRSDKGEFGTASLFQVKGPDGKTTLVDGQGAKYTDMNDYLQNNDLDDSWTMLRPSNPGAPAGEQGQLISGPAHNTTFGQQLDKFGTHVAGPAMVAGGALLVGASAVGEVGTVGLATPVAAPGAVLGAYMVAAGSGMIISGTGKDLFNRYQHGRSVEFSDPQARADWFTLATAGAGSLGASLRASGLTGLAAASDGATVGAFGAQTADQGKQLYNDWGRLTPQQRTERAAQLGANAALLGIPAAGYARSGRSLSSPDLGNGEFAKNGLAPKAASAGDAKTGGLSAEAGPPDTPRFSVSNEGRFRPYTRVPVSFDMNVGGQIYHVNPNATKHLAEYAQSENAGTLGAPGVASERGWPRSSTRDFPMSPIAASIDKAQREGLKPGRNFGWYGPFQLGIDTADNTIFHIVYNPTHGN